MAVRTKDELLDIIKTKVGDDTSDETIAFIEDVTDTITDYEEKIANSENENWKTKYEENDKKWRARYRERFFSKNVEKEDDDFEDEDEDEDEIKSLSYDALFEEKEDK